MRKLWRPQAALARWQIPPQPGRFSRVVHLLLPPGERRLVLRAPSEQQAGPERRQLSIVVTGIAVR